MKKEIPGKSVRLAASCIWLAVITYLCVIPGEEIPDKGLFSIPHLDKVVHFIMFGVLSFLLSWSFSKAVYAGKAGIVLFCILYGGLLEVVQSTWAVHRSGSWSDLMFDLLGAVLGSIFYFRIFSKFSLWKLRPNGERNI